MSEHIWIGDNTTIKWEYEGKRRCLHIRSDNCAENPRTEFDNLTTMAIWSRSCCGDDLRGMSPEEFWRDLVRKNVPEGEVWSMAEAGALRGIRIVPNADDKDLYDVYETDYVDCVFGKSEPSEYIAYEGVTADTAVEYILDDLTQLHCQTILEPYAEWMPLWIYEHGGVTISCGKRTGQYADRWDSCCAGWIIAMKDDVLRETDAKKGDWRENATNIMEADVEIFDQYLRGEVFGYESFVGEDDVDGETEWIDDESCWGFYGDDLLANGIPEAVGCGLMAALNSGAYEEGEAREEHAVRYIL